MTSVDLYCERIGPEFWAEPVNALTNAAFLAAAWGAWRLARRLSALAPGIWGLIVLVAAIGFGSFTFHTLATNWARWLDVLPILLFQLLYLWLYGRRVIGWGPFVAAGLLALFLAAALIGRQFPAILNGSLIYAPALAVILGLGIYQVRAATEARFELLAAAALLVFSLAFRSVDNAVCAALPIGTHFLWHLLNGTVVYLAVRALIYQRPIRA
ncbi:MAG: ceramidase domain-containing protein [Rhodospirillales bacterium]|jgi:hypothetical protein|nr:hypothetical protein [Rhodospirillaceae bacterium]MDP6426520.1 ceramidase domain-containing protein [Rhodospirillales bacterium]MDP6645221.1 ceramidase domain-containing protein [Rhodospirillales bacterium]MDP6840400.1 ceramidase domain-containing protein [Rhodospirillales bacterium]|tara:strand:- start:2631 stop:3269 length:639 start_codon:yes stop_codon:yes gene_type:complete